MKYAGIKRKTTYSPNHIGNDEKIFIQTIEQLTDLGVTVKIYEEENLDKINIKETFIFSMAQGVQGTKKLLELEKKGKFIINSPQSSINTYRSNMVTILQREGIKFPKSYVVSVEDNNKIKFNDFGTRKIWVKRGDVHAIHREDVTLVYSEEEKKNIFREFKKRGIEEAILQEHLDGDVIKFYSIIGTPFFHWYYLNGINQTQFNSDELIELAQKSANSLGLEIYGGDAVVSEDGSISIIDINDWPSFAPIRDKASKQIAQLIYNKVEKYELHNETKISAS